VGGRVSKKRDGAGGGNIDLRTAGGLKKVFKAEEGQLNTVAE